MADSNKTTVEICFPPPGPLISLNMREHYMMTARRVKQWRHAAAWGALACAQSWGPQLGRCEVTVYLPVTGRHRRDPHNWVPTMKAIIDGLVDAHVWPDDTPAYVVTTEPVLEVGTGPRDVRVRLVELGDVDHPQNKEAAR